MKRSVAILGPTPAFLRWAIWQPCELRPSDPYRFADQTFRHLRAIRELSVAESEQRCTDNFCFHPSALSAEKPVEEVLGFQRTEISAAFGGEACIQKNCRLCPANVTTGSGNNTVAGCFGFLAVDGFDLQKLLSGHAQQPPNISLNLVEKVQHASESLDIQDQLWDQFGGGKLVWHRLWKPQILSTEKLETVGLIFNQMIESIGTENCPKSVVTFQQAVSRCLDHDMPLHVELVPSGHSDGHWWKISAACPDCGYEPQQTEIRKPCPGCHRVGGIGAGQKFRVLGIRPYSRLINIIGPQQTKSELDRVKQDK